MGQPVAHKRRLNTPMAGILRFGLPTSLRHNITSLWLRSLLCCPNSTNVCGGQDLVQAIFKDKTFATIGVATPEADRLTHTFIAVQDDFRWFDFWTRERRLWWKRFSHNCSRFEDVRVDIDHSQIVYKRDNIVETLIRKKQGSTTVISSHIELGEAVRCLLDDARCETIKDTPCFRLHYQLVPYQVSVTVASEKLRPRADEILTNLKKSNVRCLPTVSVTPAVTPQVFQDEDFLGVYFNVYIDEDTPETSVVKVRNRDTASSEYMYIHQVVPLLARYLKTEMAYPCEKYIAQKESEQDAQSTQIRVPKAIQAKKKTVQPVQDIASDQDKRICSVTNHEDPFNSKGDRTTKRRLILKKGARKSSKSE
ncbi:uncharacterized protein LOC111273964 isoform X1 [Varroa jacobsoni]|uniref:uncharacterized protein LOC111273964 isoform X1 n=2 Tax=Varroa jacobsoni TaxID=62625 RepID=UPI000BF9E737|nr:uncharacterized protein LOC111273964 isoform X1 [Varroa jacobsoni]